MSTSCCGAGEAGSACRSGCAGWPDSRRVGDPDSPRLSCVSRCVISQSLVYDMGVFEGLFARTAVRIAVAFVP